MSWYTPDVPNLCPELRDITSTPQVTSIAPVGKRVYRSYHQAKQDGGPYCEVYAVQVYGGYDQNPLTEKDGIYTLAVPKRMFKTAVIYAVSGLSLKTPGVMLYINDSMMESLRAARFDDEHYKQAWQKIYEQNGRAQIKPYTVALYGFCRNLDDATFLVEKNHTDIYEAGEYPIVVIEEIPVKWMTDESNPEARVFYRWNTGAEKYVRMSQSPVEWQDQLVNGYAPFIHES